ncbi:MAG: hypothetical protein IKH55_09905 [Fibrobacter sp.]|nr:hypothetical protein [Fibrobacter sp.]
MQVVCKSSVVIYITIGTLLGLVLFPFLYLMIVPPLPIFSMQQIGMVILCNLIFCVFLFGYYPNYRLIFDGSGITVLRKICFFSFVLYENKIHISWNDVMDVDLPFTVVKFGLTFYTIVNSKPFFVPLSCAVTNAKQALEFAVTKLPPEKITAAARIKLKKKYGIVVE